MTGKLNKIATRYDELVNSIPLKESELDYALLDRHVPYLEQLDELGHSAVSVFDMYKKTHVYTSKSYRKLLGLQEKLNEVSEGFEKFMHPDDLLLAMESGYYFLK